MTLKRHRTTLPAIEINSIIKMFIAYEAGSVSVDGIVHFIESVYASVVSVLQSVADTSPGAVRVFKYLFDDELRLLKQESIDSTSSSFFL